MKQVLQQLKEYYVTFNLTLMQRLARYIPQYKYNM